MEGFEPSAGLSYILFLFLLFSQALSRLRPLGNVSKRPSLALLYYLYLVVYLPSLETATLSQPLWVVNPPPLYRCGLAMYVIVYKSRVIVVSHIVQKNTANIPPI